MSRLRGRHVAGPAMTSAPVGGWAASAGQGSMAMPHSARPSPTVPMRMAVPVARFTTNEAREGVAAFIERRPAAWIPQG